MLAVSGDAPVKYFEDHGLPLVRLKEQRRQLVVALSRRDGPISDAEIAEIASLQQTIAAMEAVADDVDTKIECFPFQKGADARFAVGDKKPARNVKLVFGRRLSLVPHSRQC
jgi:hypothetical protein